MPEPHPWPCGHQNEPACPPQPAIVLEDTGYFTLAQMQAHGSANYQKGIKDQKELGQFIDSKKQ